MTAVAVSRQALETFEVRPTPPTVGPGEMPDELMIDWNNVPIGQSAELYLPAVSADDVLARASKLYPVHRLTRVDANTIGCTTGGVSYIPLPPGSGNGANFAGLMSIALPPGIKRGEVYTVVVRQVTNASNVTVTPQTSALFISGKREVHHWRRVLGTFQINIPVSTKEALLEKEQLRLSIFRWIGTAIPVQSRWRPVFDRYLELIAIRVSEMGGDPHKIRPSANGYDGVKPHRKSREERGERESRFTGRVVAIAYGRSGEFEGFTLECSDERERCFKSREREVEAVVREAWKKRIVTTVVADEDDRDQPVSIILRRSAERHWWWPWRFS
jgi:hypothetical protein